MPRPKGSGEPQNLARVLPGQRGANGNGGRKHGTRNKITELRLSQEVARIAFSDPIGLFQRTHGGRRKFSLKEIDAMSADMRACIASVKVKTENLTAGDDQQDQTVEVKLWDKTKMLELLAKKFGWVKTEPAPPENLEALVSILSEWKRRNALAQAQAIDVVMLPAKTEAE